MGFKKQGARESYTEQAPKNHEERLRQSLDRCGVESLERKGPNDSGKRVEHAYRAKDLSDLI